MRILYFTRDYTTHDYRFLEALGQTSHEVYFMQLERRGHVLEDRPLPTSIELVSWEGGREPYRLQDSFRYVRSLRKVIKSIRPDILHAGPIQTAAFLSALSGFRNLVSMSWGYDLQQDANRSEFWRKITRFTLRRSASFVGDCETIKDLAVAMGMRPDRIVIFPWGVDLDHFNLDGQKNQLNPADGPFTILSTRSWEPIYGVDLVAEAFAAASRICPELRLVMTGNGSLAGRLQAAFRKAGVQEQVVLPGYIRQVDLPTFYRSADLYISASHSDGSSISLLEAMACGCPVLVSDIPGNLEWVESGQQGWLFPDGDVDALTRSIVHAFKNKHLLADMGQSARQTVEKRANWKQNFPKLLQAYEMASSN